MSLPIVIPDNIMMEIVYGLLMAMLGWIGWSIRQRFVTRKDHDALAVRVTAVETKITLVPSKEDIQQVLLRLTELTGELKLQEKVQDQKFNGLTEAIDQLRRQTARIEEHLLEAK